MGISQLAKQASVYSSAKFFEFLVKFFVPILLVRIFTKEDYGLYRQLNLISLTFPVFISLGIHTSFYFFIRTFDNIRNYNLSGFVQYHPNSNIFQTPEMY